MKLLTKAIEAKIPPLYSTDGVEIKDIVVKFFCPSGSATWYVFEGSKHENGDWEFFGRADLFGDGGELGYFYLSQLEDLTCPFGLKVERDRHFDGYVDHLGEIKRKELIAA